MFVTNFMNESVSYFESSSLIKIVFLTCTSSHQTTLVKGLCLSQRYIWLSFFGALQKSVACFFLKHIDNFIYILDKYFSFSKHINFFFFINRSNWFIAIDYFCCILCISIILLIMFWFDGVLICIIVGVVYVRFIWYQEKLQVDFHIWLLILWFLPQFFLWVVFQNFLPLITYPRFLSCGPLLVFMVPTQTLDIDQRFFSILARSPTFFIIYSHISDSTQLPLLISFLMYSYMENFLHPCVTSLKLFWVCFCTSRCVFSLCTQ